MMVCKFQLRKIRTGGISLKILLVVFRVTKILVPKHYNPIKFKISRKNKFQQNIPFKMLLSQFYRISKLPDKFEEKSYNMEVLF